MNKAGVGEKRLCSMCGESKALSDFYWLPSTLRYTPRCKPCVKVAGKISYRRNRGKALVRERKWRKQNGVYIKKYRIRNAARAKQYTQKHRREHPEMYREYRARRKARKLNLLTPAELPAMREFYKHAQTAADIPCYWCGKPTRTGTREVDHIVPLSRGGKHSIHNLCVSCVKCNRGKQAMMPDVFSGQGILRLEGRAT